MFMQADLRALGRAARRTAAVVTPVTLLAAHLINEHFY